jgi:hypothetical protein
MVKDRLQLHDVWNPPVAVVGKASRAAVTLVQIECRQKSGEQCTVWCRYRSTPAVNIIHIVNWVGGAGRVSNVTNYWNRRIELLLPHESRLIVGHGQVAVVHEPRLARLRAICGGDK